MEENFRNAMVISQGSLDIFVQRPLSLAFVLISAALLLAQVFARARRGRGRPAIVPPAAINTGAP
jgi:TctA family transporter